MTGTPSTVTVQAEPVLETANVPTPSQSAPKPTSIPASPGVTRLILWVPPQFDPVGGTRAGRLLEARLLEYSLRHPQVEIVVRVKAESGASNLLESLAATSVAAPEAVPSLIALSRKDLETAAVKGYVYPIDDLSSIMKSGDWYPYSHQMAEYEGFTYGIPFAGNIMLMVYRPVKFATTLKTWDEILQLMKPVAFPVSDPAALFPLALYQSLGGDIADDQERPVLQPEVFKEVLKLYADGNLGGVFPNWLIPYASDNQVWEVYREERSDFLVTWSTSFLAEIPADSTILPLPQFTTESKPFTLADGWVWAFSDSSPEKRAVAVDLAEYLVESGFLADWSEEAGYVPPRPSALGGWTNKSLVTALSQISASASIQPENKISSTVGPVLQEAVQQVIEQLNDPGQAAQAAAERILAPTY